MLVLFMTTAYAQVCFIHVCTVTWTRAGLVASREWRRACAFTCVVSCDYICAIYLFIC